VDKKQTLQGAERKRPTLERSIVGRGRGGGKGDLGRVVKLLKKKGEGGIDKGFYQTKKQGTAYVDCCPGGEHAR